MKRRFCLLSILLSSACLLCLFAVSTGYADEGLAQELSSNKLFFDNFDEEIRLEWTAAKGKWRMVNGALQPVEGATAWVELIALDLGDGSLEFKIGSLDTCDKYNNEFWLGIKRQHGSDAGYWFQMYQQTLSCYLGRENTETIKYHEKRIYAHSGNTYVLRIETKGDLIKIFIDGEQYCSYADDTFKRGFISIVTMPRESGNPYPCIDDFTIYE